MLGFGSSSTNIPSNEEAVRYKKINELLNGQRMSQVLKLKSGEQMTYAEVGDRAGIPCIWFAGPTNTRFIISLYSDICTLMGIRLLCFDRPGRGGSTPIRDAKSWSFSQWGAYIDEATDLLKIPAFHAISHSLGTSYLLASVPALKNKLIGSLRFLATWAPSNLPCMPTMYALQRSLPTKMLRGLMGVGESSTVGGLRYRGLPCQLGSIGNREKDIVNDYCSREILERLGADHLGDSYPAYEMDWLLALEVQKPLGYTHSAITIPIKCWHGMDDSITPLGAAMWMQREMTNFLLYAVEGATHNIHLDLAIVKAVFADVCAEHLTAMADNVEQGVVDNQGGNQKVPIQTMEAEVEADAETRSESENGRQKVDQSTEKEDQQTASASASHAIPQGMEEENKVWE